MKKSLVVFLTLSILTVSVVTVFAEGEASAIVIANPNVSQDSVKSADLAKLFLGKNQAWSDGQKMVPVTLESGSAHDSFLKMYLKKSASQFSTFWKQAIFTGQGIPPKSFKSEAELVDYVKKVAGAIGYISSETPHEGVKVLKVE